MSEVKLENLERLSRDVLQSIVYVEAVRLAKAQERGFALNAAELKKAAMLAGTLRDLRMIELAPPPDEEAQAATNDALLAQLE